jgi:hypothetical protein
MGGIGGSGGIGEGLEPLCEGLKTTKRAIPITRRSITPKINIVRSSILNSIEFNLINNFFKN